MNDYITILDIDRITPDRKTVMAFYKGLVEHQHRIHRLRTDDLENDDGWGDDWEDEDDYGN